MASTSTHKYEHVYLGVVFSSQLIESRVKLKQKYWKLLYHDVVESEKTILDPCLYLDLHQQ